MKNMILIFLGVYSLIGLNAFAKADTIDNKVSDFFGWVGFKDSDVRACDQELNANPKDWISFEEEQLSVLLPIWPKFEERQVVLFSSGVQSNKATLSLHIDSRHCANIKIYDWTGFSKVAKRIGLHIKSEDDLVVRTTEYSYQKVAENLVYSPVLSEFKIYRKGVSKAFFVTDIDQKVLSNESGIIMKLFYYDFSPPAETLEARVNLLVRLGSVMNELIRQLDSRGVISDDTKSQFEISAINVVNNMSGNGILEQTMRSESISDLLFLNLFGSYFNLLYRGEIKFQTETASILPMKLPMVLASEYVYRFKYLCDKREFQEKFGALKRMVQSFDVLEFYMNRALQVVSSGSYSPIIEFMESSAQIQERNGGHFKGVLFIPMIKEKLQAMDASINHGRELLATPFGQLSGVFTRLKLDLVDLPETKYNSFVENIEGLQARAIEERVLYTKYKMLKNAIHRGASIDLDESELDIYRNSEKLRKEFISLFQQRSSELATYRSLIRESSKAICK